MNIPAITNPSVGQLAPLRGDWHSYLPPFFWGGLFTCCWLKLCLFFPFHAWSQQTIESEYVAFSPAEFYLPSVESERWHHARDFRGRPLVLLHFSSWSPSARRLLPLWYQRLKPAIERQQLSVVVVAHEPHAARAALFCRAHGIDVLVLHDPLTAGLGAAGTPSTNPATAAPARLIPTGPTNTVDSGQVPSELPWAMAFDANGRLQNQRLTLNRTEEDLWTIGNEPPSLTPERFDSADSDNLSSPIVVSDLIQQLMKERDDSDPDGLARQKAAELLLRHAMIAEGSDAQQALATVVGCYEQIWQVAPTAEVSHRLALARHRSFELSAGSDTSAFQSSIGLLQIASRGPAPPPFWAAWARVLGPQVDKEFAAYDWIEPVFEQEPGQAPDDLFRRPLFAAEQLGPHPDIALELSESPFATPTNERSTPVPWASVRVDPIWAPSLDPEKPWARLYLRIHFKRGTWSLEAATQLKWAFVELDAADQPRWNDLSVRNARRHDSLEAEELWVETDVWFPPALFAEIQKREPGTTSDDPVSPRRNAQLIFRGRDPLTGQLDWRQLDFHLPLPMRAKVDW